MTGHASTSRVRRILVSREMADDTAFLESMEADPAVELVWPVGEGVWDYEDELMRRVSDGRSMDTKPPETGQPCDL